MWKRVNKSENQSKSMPGRRPGTLLHRCVLVCTLFHTCPDSDFHRFSHLEMSSAGGPVRQMANTTLDAWWQAGGDRLQPWARPPRRMRGCHTSERWSAPESPVRPAATRAGSDNSDVEQEILLYFAEKGWYSPPRVVRNRKIHEVVSNCTFWTPKPGHPEGSSGWSPTLVGSCRLSQNRLSC